MQLGTPQIFNRHPLSPPPVLIPQLTTSHHHIHTVRQPPTLPLFVFAASTARSMGLLTRVGICVRPPPPLVRPVHLHSPPSSPSPLLPADPLPQTVHQPSRHQLPSPQCLSATLYRVIIKFPRTDTKRIARPVLAPLSENPAAEWLTSTGGKMEETPCLRRATAFSPSHPSFIYPLSP